MNYSLSNSLTKSTGSVGVISGFAYPLETLTSTRAGQWTVDGVPSGSPSSTFEVPLLSIGSVIRCGNSAPVTVWHPDDIASVARFWMAARNAYNSVSPDVLATNGQTVRRWNGIISGTQADQTIAANQPIYRSAGQGGNPSVQFDGSNDFFDLPSNSDVFQNKSQGYLIAGVRDTNVSAGSSLHPVAFYSIAGSNALSRLSILTRGNASNEFSASSRRNDADTFTVANASSNQNYNVLAAHGDWSSGFVRLRINASVVASTLLAGGSGNTSNTASLSSAIGGIPASSNALPGHITAVCAINATISATDLSRIERYIGLLGGLTTIPLV